MTYRERLEKECPGDVDFIVSHHCPESYWTSLPNFDCSGADITCEECWDSVIPDREMAILGIPESPSDKDGVGV